MKYDQHSPEQLLDQMLENSASLCQVELEFKAAHQRGDELLRDFQAQMVANRRSDRRVLLGLFAIASITCCVVHLVYPNWLSEQIATISSLIKHM